MEKEVKKAYPNYNVVAMDCRLTKDPVSKTFNEGTKEENTITEFGVACNGFKEVADFFWVSISGKRAIHAKELLKKGMRILIEGRLSNSNWETDKGEKRSKTYIRCENFYFLEKKNPMKEDGESEFLGEKPTTAPTTPLAKQANAAEQETGFESKQEINADEVPF